MNIKINLPKIAIFYHLGQLGNWEELYLEHMNLLVANGLYDACEFIHIGINGNLPLPKVFNKSRIKYNSDHVLEANTLESLWNFSQENRDYKILFFHSKGVTHGINSPFNDNVIAWRKYLEYFNIVNWKDSVQYLNEYDCTSVELLDTSYHNDIVIPGLFYAGNFWWANSQYISTLDTNFLYDNTNGLARWQSEKWIGTGNPRAHSQFNFNCVEYYNFNYPKEFYIKQEMTDNQTIQTNCEDKIVEILNKFQINGWGNNLENGTDKADWHSYDKLYGKYLNNYIDKKGTLLEIGVWRGGSSVLWSNLLPNFDFCLVDIENKLSIKNRQNLDFTKTRYIITDAYHIEVKNQIKDLYPQGFDVIIDDGPHTVESQIKCVELYLDTLTDNGVLIIEDITSTENLQLIINSIPKNYDYVVEDYRHLKGRFDDLAIVIKKKTLSKKPKIVMNTMFRNEATVIKRMLESCYKYIDYYVIQNNGSTDGTDEIVREFFADKNIPGILYNVEEGWQGFGWNRDHLMQYTQNTNHGCDWILKMDCDEVLEVDEDMDWTPFEDLSIHSFHITAITGSSIYYRAWMWNAHMPWRFNHDPCHETSYCPIEGIGENFQRYDLPNKIRQIGFPQGQSWSNPTKFISDALILEEKMIKENSILTDLYHFWYIGKSYHDARQGSFPLGSSQQIEFSRRCIYYFTEYLNTTHDFSNTKTANGIHEMAYMALIFLSSDQKFIGDIDSAIENLILSEQFAPERNDHLVALAEIYNQQQQYDKMLEITTRLVDPNRKNPFPTYHLMINSNAYVDTGNYVQSLHDIAKSNLPQKLNPFMINTQLDKKLFVVDNFYSNPDQIREFALNVEFKEDIKWYKGKRSTQHYHPPGIVEAFENIIGQKIVKFDQSMPNGCFQITTANDPQVYHHDLQKWAAMIYLTPNAPIESGTRLMRSKINQAAHMNDPNINDAFSGGFLDATKFEVVADAGNLYNRLVIMDAQNIHSAGTYFGQNNDTGRLTHLFFFD